MLTRATYDKVMFPVSVEVNGAPVGVTFDEPVALVNCQPVIATEAESTLEIQGEEVSVTFDGTNVIVNGEEVGVCETVGGGTASAVVKGESVDVNGGSVSDI